MIRVQAALTRDIQETMRGWAQHLRECALIFVHAPSANAAPLFHGDAPPLDRGDLRVRSVPFTTRRPTFSETKRVAQTLLTVTASEAPAALAPPASGVRLCSPSPDGLLCACIQIAQRSGNSLQDDRAQSSLC